MSQASSALPLASSRGLPSSAMIFGAAAMAIALLAAALAGWAPLGLSLVTVFLFAGLHNWLEFRYFLTRMPPRWGRLRGYFLLAIGGVILLTLCFIGITLLARSSWWSGDLWHHSISSWNTALVLWIATLCWMRGRERTGRDWSWVWPPAFCLVALAWLYPGAWDLGLVYLHPLMALAFLQRELRRRHKSWLPAYYTALAMVPVLLVLLVWRLAAAPNLPGSDALTVRISQHAGSHILQGVSTHLLVAVHTFLESLHYGVWIIAIPLLGITTLPWKLKGVPLARKSTSWRRGVAVFLACGAAVVVLLWGAFSIDYPLTRDVYFTAAIFHVLAEFPFLLRAL